MAEGPKRCDIVPYEGQILKAVMEYGANGNRNHTIVCVLYVMNDNGGFDRLTRERMREMNISQRAVDTTFKVAFGR